MTRLSSILLSIESSKLEMKLWEVAVNTCVSEIKDENLMEILDSRLDIELIKIPNNSVLLENIDINYHLDEGFLDDFKTVAAEKWETLKHFWKETLASFIKIAEVLQIEFNELKTLLLNGEFYNAFKRASKDLLNSLKHMADVWSETFSKAQNFIFKNIKASVLGKDMNTFASFIDEKLKGSEADIWKKAIRIILGGAVVWISYKIWTEMFFIGDWRYDFDYSNAVGTMLGTTDFKDVLGEDFIPTLFWFVSGIIESSLNLVFPCPPSCNWFGSGNAMAAVFITGYILSTNGTLDKIKKSNIGIKIQKYLSKIPRHNITVNAGNIDFNSISKSGGLLIPIH